MLDKEIKEKQIKAFKDARAALEKSIKDIEINLQVVVLINLDRIAMVINEDEWN